MALTSFMAWALASSWLTRFNQPSKTSPFWPSKSLALIRSAKRADTASTCTPQRFVSLAARRRKDLVASRRFLWPWAPYNASGFKEPLSTSATRVRRRARRCHARATVPRPAASSKESRWRSITSELNALYNPLSSCDVLQNDFSLISLLSS